MTRETSQYSHFGIISPLYFTKSNHTPFFAFSPVHGIKS